MNKYTSIGIIILVLGIFTGIGMIASAQDQDDTPPMPPVVNENITKLDIIPQYGNVRLQPGENIEIMVTVKNNENQPVSVRPNITISPYGTYVIDTDWIAITPTTAEIPAGESVRFTINVSIPKDTAIGNSNVQIAFTDEIIPTPYPQSTPTDVPQPVSTYAHVFQLSIDVWKPPNLQINIPYINDQLEAGKVYDYEIKVKNIGNSAVEISPILVNDVYYGPYGTAIPILTDESITITAPNSIPAGTIETINIHVNVPTDVRGYYTGYIDLRPDDPSVREGDARIMLNFNIWKQPTEPFIKTFILDRLAPITIEISSYLNNYPYLKTQREEPSFDVSIVGPDGDTDINITKTVIKGNVNMGSDIPLWEIGNVVAYQETVTQYTATYKADGSPGEWKVNILSNNTQGFDYSMTIGE